MEKDPGAEEELLNQHIALCGQDINLFDATELFKSSLGSTSFSLEFYQILVIY